MKAFNCKCILVLSHVLCHWYGTSCIQSTATVNTDLYGANHLNLTKKLEPSSSPGLEILYLQCFLLFNTVGGVAFMNLALKVHYVMSAASCLIISPGRIVGVVLLKSHRCRWKSLWCDSEIFTDKVMYKGLFTLRWVTFANSLPHSPTPGSYSHRRPKEICKTLNICASLFMCLICRD